VVRGYRRHGPGLIRGVISPYRWHRKSPSPDRIVPGAGGGEELRLLREWMGVVSQRLDAVRRMVEDKELDIGQKTKTVAVVDEGECTGCGLCCQVCPTGAVSVNGYANIDGSKCTACLACVERCPQGAIAVRYRA
jgi:ferredoxin